jgi:hypothetical protein
MASENGHLDVVKLLLDHGCDPTTGNNWTIRHASANGHLNVVKLLFKWYLKSKTKIPKIPLNKIKQEIIHDTFLIHELRIPEELCHLIYVFT